MFDKELVAIASENGADNCVEILMEECAELIQACSKYLRMDGRRGVPTDMAHKEVYESLVEEIGDVKICIDQVIKAIPIDGDAINEGMKFKIRRRLKGLYKETGEESYLWMADEMLGGDGTK